MKKYLLFIYVGIVALFNLGFTSCSSDADAKVEAFVETLNSDKFKSEVLASQIFTDSKATVEDDMVVLTYKLVPGISMASVDKTALDQQKLILTNELKSHVADDSQLKEGFEGMKEKDMKLRMVFEDVNGNKPYLEIQPKDIL